MLIDLTTDRVARKLLPSPPPTPSPTDFQRQEMAYQPPSDLQRVQAAYGEDPVRAFDLFNSPATTFNYAPPQAPPQPYRVNIGQPMPLNAPGRMTGGNTGGLLGPILGANIPGARRVAETAGDVTRTAGPYAAHVLPGAGLLQELGEALPNVPTPSGIAAEGVEAAVPQQVWQAVLEFVPGIGSMPGALSAFKAEMPALRVAARRSGMAIEDFIASRQGKEALEAVMEKRGIRAIAGAAEPPMGPGGNVPELPASAGPANLPAPPEAISDERFNAITQKLTAGIKRGRKLEPLQKQMISEQKAGRIGRAEELLRGGKGFESYHAYKGALANEYEKPAFEAIDLSPEDAQWAVDFIAHSDADRFTKGTAVGAIEKMTNGIKPQPAEFDQLEKVWPTGRVFEQMFERAALAGPGPQGAGPIAAEMRKLPSRGATQLELGSDPARTMARIEEATASIRQRLADADQLAAEQRTRLSQTAAEMRALPPEGPLGPEIVSMEQALEGMPIRTPAEAPPRSFAEQLSFDQVLAAQKGDKASGSVFPPLKPRPMKPLDWVFAPWQLLRSFKTAFDASFGGNQGWRLLFSDRRAWWAGQKATFKTMLSDETGSRRIMQTLEADSPNYARAQRMARPLGIMTTGGGANPAEEFLSPLTSRIPLMNRSERMFTTGGSVMRQTALDRKVELWKAANPDKYLDDATFQSMIDQANTMTGWGDLSLFYDHRNLSVVSQMLFSARAKAALIQYPVNAAKAIMSGDREMAKMAAGDLGAWIAGNLVTLGLPTAAATLATAAGYDKLPKPFGADTNPLSANFGQLHLGKQKFDIWQGYAPIVKTVIQIATGKRQPLGYLAPQDLTPTERFELLGKYTRSQFSPTFGAIYDIFFGGGKNVLGQSVLTKEYWVSEVAPMFFADVADSLRESGALGLIGAGASFGGIRSQAYGPNEGAEKANVKTLAGRIGIGQQTKAQVWDEYAKGTEMERYGSLDEWRDAYVDYWTQQRVEQRGESEEVAHDKVLRAFNNLDDVQMISRALGRRELAIWKAHPDVLRQAVDAGVVPLTKELKPIYNAARKSTPAPSR